MQLLVYVLRKSAEAALELFNTGVTLFGISQASSYHRHGLRWAEIDYFLQVRQVHIETLNNMREDIRDMYDMDSRKLDTKMIISTLLLSIGFGFVVEGTFPPADPQASGQQETIYQGQHMMRVAYAAVAALALLCPFFALLSLLECKRRLDFFMDSFNDKYYRMCNHRFKVFLDETCHADSMHQSNLVRYTKGLPKDNHEDLAQMYESPASSICPQRATEAPRRWFRCSRRQRKRPAFLQVDDAELDAEEEQVPDLVDKRREESRAATLGQVLQSGGVHAPGDFLAILGLHSHYAKWWFDWCSRLNSIAEVCTWLAIAFNVLCCSVLLGMYFQLQYLDTPAMWHVYAGFVVLGLLVALSGSSLCRLWGPSLEVRRKHLPPDCDESGIPKWMNEPLLRGEEVLDNHAMATPSEDQTGQSARLLGGVL
eukprot:TRINITY_DN28946_c0_g1_i2.p1 TRINITY_DN28946_c0_g1~~TRINITY_DN28946_c0_g1_i2.p1  ORF type:complete len:433 (-),score=87.96 TRINITY_DN28946_c0_g1_i2:42-1319(-)